HTHVSTILADVVRPKCAARVSALTSRKRLTLAPVRLGWGLEGFAEKHTLPFPPPRLTNANSNPRAPPPYSTASFSPSCSFSRATLAHPPTPRVHPHRVGAEVGIKCCRRGGLDGRDQEGVGERRPDRSVQRSERDGRIVSREELVAITRTERRLRFTGCPLMLRWFSSSVFLGIFGDGLERIEYTRDFSGFRKALVL
ncbi:hypothetical protein WH47_03553, partial [Habropoda laboriosa]